MAKVDAKLTPGIGRGGGRAGPVLIATLTGALALSAGDFIVI